MTRNLSQTDILCIPVLSVRYGVIEMEKNTHLTYDDRLEIQKSLAEGASFKEIGRRRSKDCTTISKEIRRHYIPVKSGGCGRTFNDCKNRRGCSAYALCSACKWPKPRTCSNCNECAKHCGEYEKEICQQKSNPPYCCNGCKKRSRCTLEKNMYDAKLAQNEYEYVRSESRAGIVLEEREVTQLDTIVSPLARQGHSIHSICVTHANEITCSEKTLYTYVNSGILSIGNLDLPRKVRYKPRKKAQIHKVDRQCYIGRTYEDFKQFTKENPDVAIVEIDSVEGTKGGNVLLTIHFVQAQCMLAFLRLANNAQSVIDIFNQLYASLGAEQFGKLFPVILTDRGTEFSNPMAIEFDCDGNRRTRIFYCNPNAPFEKGAAENNHEFIRKVIPKGKSLDPYAQNDISKLMNHVNSYVRKKLNDNTPIAAFSFFYGSAVSESLGLCLIPPDEIILTPKLLRK